METWEKLLKNQGSKKNNRKEAWAKVKAQLSKYMSIKLELTEKQIEQFFDLDNDLKNEFGVFDKDDA